MTLSRRELDEAHAGRKTNADCIGHLDYKRFKPRETVIPQARAKETLEIEAKILDRTTGRVTIGERSLKEHSKKSIESEASLGLSVSVSRRHNGRADLCCDRRSPFIPCLLTSAFSTRP